MRGLGAVVLVTAFCAAGYALAQDSASVDLAPDKPAPPVQAAPNAARKPVPTDSELSAPRRVTEEDEEGLPAAKSGGSNGQSYTQKPGQKFDPMKMGLPPPPPALAPVKPLALVLRGLDKITGRPTLINAPINQPVQFATLTITARYCYSTPQSETPETSAFVQIVDHRPDQSSRIAFSGWMYASSPGLNGMQHPLYDVWVIGCRTDAPGDIKPVASTTAVKPQSPNAGSTDDKVELPEGADQ